MCWNNILNQKGIFDTKICQSRNQGASTANNRSGFEWHDICELDKEGASLEDTRTNPGSAFYHNVGEKWADKFMLGDLELLPLCKNQLYRSDRGKAILEKKAN